VTFRALREARYGRPGGPGGPAARCCRVEVAVRSASEAGAAKRGAAG